MASTSVGEVSILRANLDLIEVSSFGGTPMPLFGRKRQKLFQLERHDILKVEAVLSTLDMPGGLPGRGGHGPTAQNPLERQVLSEAVTLMLQARDRDSNEPLYVLMAASYQMALGAFVQALDILNRGAKEHPKDSRVHYALAGAYYRISPPDAGHRSPREEAIVRSMSGDERIALEAALAARGELGLSRREVLELAVRSFDNVLSGELDRQEKVVVETSRQTVQTDIHALG